MTASAGRDDTVTVLIVASAGGRDGPAGQHSSDHKLTVRVECLTSEKANFWANFDANSCACWTMQVNGICKLERCLLPPFAASLSNNLPLFARSHELNDCDQPTLIILTGFLQFDEYVARLLTFLVDESDFKIGPL